MARREPIPAEREETMEQRINIDINRELWRQLSIRCAERDILKKEAVEQAIGGWLKKTKEDEMSDLRWEETAYSEDGKDFPAVYIYWGDVREFLGEDHTGDPAQDQKLVEGLLDAGAPGWVKNAPGWIDEEGWGVYQS